MSVANPSSPEGSVTNSMSTFTIVESNDQSFNSIANIGDGNCKQERGSLIPEKEKIDLKCVHDNNRLLEQ